MSNPTPTNPNQGSFFGSFYMVLASLAFALMLVFIKLSGQKFGMNTYEITFWRVFFALVVLGGFSWMKGRDFRTNHPKEHFWRSLAGSVALLMNFYVVLHLPLATASTLQNTSAIFLGLLSIIILKQKPSPMAWLSLILGFIGVVILLKPTTSGDTFAMLVGLGSGAISGYAYLQVREMSLLGEPAWRIVFYFSLLSTLTSGVLAWYFGFTPVSLASLPYIVGIGVTALAGQLLMTYAYQVGQKFVVATLSYLGVVFAIVFGAWLFGERLDALSLVGIGMIVTSGVLSGKR
ncbi:DMT family transporter [Moraxella ovis]|uniref:DMT family transporter n=1 Tax=Moraxella ovis TaxID=29433 RepID=UPI000D8E9A06|nr:DMT family transporter [Moraxella ovis]SPX85925.1 Predicted permeases [Moraxella ovis]STZ06871.1 Predicted permeases [Moraxella ovis]